MFDFERLDLYKVCKELNIKVFNYIRQSSHIDPFIIDQWKRASLSILLNLSEGVGRIKNNDKQHFFTIARGSVFESVAILDFLKSSDQIEEDFYQEAYVGYEQLSKMLLGLYRSYNK